jgi:hypothetical protein
LEASIVQAKHLTFHVHQASKSKKPIKYLQDELIKSSQYFVKSSELQNVLKTFKLSKELRIKSKSFITNKINDNKIWVFEYVFKKGLQPSEVVDKH